MGQPLGMIQRLVYRVVTSSTSSELVSVNRWGRTPYCTRIARSVLFDGFLPLRGAVFFFAFNSLLSIKFSNGLFSCGSLSLCQSRISPKWPNGSKGALPAGSILQLMGLRVVCVGHDRKGPLKTCQPAHPLPPSWGNLTWANRGCSPLVRHRRRVYRF